MSPPPKRSKQQMLLDAIAVFQEHYGVFVLLTRAKSGKTSIDFHPQPQSNTEGLHPHIKQLIADAASHPWP